MIDLSEEEVDFNVQTTKKCMSDQSHGQKTFLIRIQTFSAPHP